MQIPQSKYHLGDQVLCIDWGGYLFESFHYFGTISLVGFDPYTSDSGLAALEGVCQYSLSPTTAATPPAPLFPH